MERLGVFADRSGVSPRESMAKLRNDALLQDSRFRWKQSLRNKAGSLLRFLIVAPPVCYYFYVSLVL